MRINKIRTPIINSKYNTNTNSSSPVIKNAQNKALYQIPAAENIKAYFLPSFGNLRTVGQVVLTDRNTKEDVLATLKRDMYGSTGFLYEIYDGHKKAGYMDMDLYSPFLDDSLMDENEDTCLPEIIHLRSLMGDKYEGIGSALVNCAIEESKKHKKDGCVWLVAEQGFARGLSDYRKNENPIPFYYKLGFKTLGPTRDKEIRKCLETHRYNMLPSTEILILTAEDSKKYNKYLAKHCIISK